MLATERKVSASSYNQGLIALLLLPRGNDSAQFADNLQGKDLIYPTTPPPCLGANAATKAIQGAQNAPVFIAESQGFTKAQRQFGLKTAPNSRHNPSQGLFSGRVP